MIFVKLLLMYQIKFFKKGFYFCDPLFTKMKHKYSETSAINNKGGTTI